MIFFLKKSVAYFSNKLHLDINYFVKGSFFLSTPILVSYLLGLLRSIIFTRLAVQETYGQYNYILSVVSVISILSLPGINVALIETVARGNTGSLIDAARIRFRWGLLVTLTITGIALYYALVEKTNNLAITFLIAGTLAPLGSAFNTISAYYNGQKRFDVTSKLTIIILVLKTVLLILLLWLQKGLPWLIVANSLAEVLLYGLYYLIAIQSIDNEPHDPDMISYGKLLTWVSIVDIIGGKLDSVILGLSVGFINLAIYKVATILPNSIKGLMKASSTLFIPKIAERTTQQIYTTHTKKHLFYLFSFNVSIIIISIILLPIVISFLYGKQYTDSIRFGQFLLLSLVFGWPAAFFEASLKARKQTKAIYNANIISGILSIGTIIMTVPFLGIWGVILSRIITRWGRTFYQWYVVRTL